MRIITLVFLLGALSAANASFERFWLGDDLSRRENECGECAPGNEKDDSCKEWNVKISWVSTIQCQFSVRILPVASLFIVLPFPKLADRLCRSEILLWLWIPYQRRETV